MAIAGCAVATLLLTAAPGATTHWVPATSSAVQSVVPSLRNSRLPSRRAEGLHTGVQFEEGQDYTGASLSSPRLTGTSSQIPTLALPAFVALVLAAAASLRRLMVPGSSVRSQGYYSLETAPSAVMLAVAGEDDSSNEASKKDWVISRRGLAPVLAGAMAAPSFFGRAAFAADGVPAPKMEGQSVVIANPREWIATNLPGAIPGKEFSRLTTEILLRQGLIPQNTVPCVGVCRDELCQPLVDEIEAEWGDAFNMTSLGGMLTLGKTGMRAAMAHSPVDNDGRERYFFMAFPHVSVDTAGVGTCTRPGRTRPSKACGALAAFTNELKSGKASAQDDPLDPEYSFMKAALLDLIPAGTAPDLLEVTKTAAQASQDQLEKLVAATVDPAKADYALFVGVLVHEQDVRPKNAKVIGAGRQYLDQVWPTAFYSVVGGRKKDLIWRLDRD